MKRYILRETLDGAPVHDGVFPGLGIITHGQPFTPSYPEQEELVKADPRFKEYRAPVEASVTEPEKVDGEAGNAATGGGR